MNTKVQLEFSVTPSLLPALCDQSVEFLSDTFTSSVIFTRTILYFFNTNLPWQVKGSFSSVATGKWTEIKRVWQWSSSFWMKEDWIQKQVCNENIVQVFIIDCLNCINLYMSVPYLNISVQVWEDIYPQLKRTCKTMCFHFAGTWDNMSLTFTSWSWRSLPVLAADQLLYYNQNS